MSFFVASPRQSTLVDLQATTEHQTDAVAPYDSTTSIRIDADGNVYKASSSNGGALSYVLDYAWVIPNSLAGGYECRVTSVDHNAGATAGSGWSLSPGADGTWFALTSDRTWNTNETAGGDYDTTATMEIRPTGGSTIASATFNWSILNTT